MPLARWILACPLQKEKVSITRLMPVTKYFAVCTSTTQIALSPLGHNKQADKLHSHSLQSALFPFLSLPPSALAPMMAPPPSHPSPSFCLPQPFSTSQAGSFDPSYFVESSTLTRLRDFILSRCPLPSLAPQPAHSSPDTRRSLVASHSPRDTVSRL